MLAAVQIGEGTRRLADISVAPAAAVATDAGYLILHGIMEQITGAAYAQGFQSVEFQGERLTGATVGRVARVTRRRR